MHGDPIVTAPVRCLRLGDSGERWLAVGACLATQHMHRCKTASALRAQPGIHHGITEQTWMQGRHTRRVPGGANASATDR
jgi:hypothetical protein